MLRSALYGSKVGHAIAGSNINFGSHFQLFMADCSDILHRRDEPVSPPRQGLDKARIVSIIAKRFANFVDSFIQSVLKINERVLRPELVVQFLAGDDLAGLLQQSDEHVERLAA